MLVPQNIVMDLNNISNILVKMVSNPNRGCSHLTQNFGGRMNIFFIIKVNISCSLMLYEYVIKL